MSGAGMQLQVEIANACRLVGALSERRSGQYVESSADTGSRAHYSERKAGKWRVGRRLDISDLG